MQSLKQYKDQVQVELTEDILPFQMSVSVDKEKGGFHGRIANDLTVDQGAPKGLVQHSRILWAFAHAYRHLGIPAYLETASRAYRYLLHNFWDAYHHGLVWLVNVERQPIDNHKIIYGQTFAIYGLSEYFLATGEKQSLDMAIALYHVIEQSAADTHFGGYFEAFEQDWRFTNAINVDETAVLPLRV